jgi:hypothetical protein
MSITTNGNVHLNLTAGGAPVGTAAAGSSGQIEYNSGVAALVDLELRRAANYQVHLLHIGAPLRRELCYGQQHDRHLCVRGFDNIAHGRIYRQQQKHQLRLSLHAVTSCAVETPALLARTEASYRVPAPSARCSIRRSCARPAAGNRISEQTKLAAAAAWIFIARAAGGGNSTMRCELRLTVDDNGVGLGHGTSRGGRGSELLQVVQKIRRALGVR